MKIAEAAETAAALVRERKEILVQKAKGPADIESLIVAYRGASPVATITYPRGNRDTMLKLVEMTAGGFSADVVSLTNESYGTEGSPEMVKDPRTGQPWQYGALASYFDEYGPDNGVVYEQLMTNVANRADDVKMIRQPYVVRGINVEWLDPVELPDALLLGDVPAAMQAAMQLKTFAQMFGNSMVAGMLGDPELEQTFMDGLAASQLDRMLPVGVQLSLAAKPGSRRSEFLKEKLGQSRVIVAPVEEWVR